MDTWIQTYSGGQFFYDELTPDGIKRESHIDIIDIARSLSRAVRFYGHMQSPVSIAEHSIVVSQIIETEGGTDYQQIAGLLHDAHEAYIGDISAPLKHFLQGRYGIDLRTFERSIDKRIFATLDIPWPSPKDEDLVKRADMIALKVERDLFAPSNHAWNCDHIEAPEDYYGFYGNWGDDEAMRYFENLYDRLKKSVDFQRRTEENSVLAD